MTLVYFCHKAPVAGTGGKTFPLPAEITVCPYCRLPVAEHRKVAA